MARVSDHSARANNPEFMQVWRALIQAALEVARKRLSEEGPRLRRRTRVVRESATTTRFDKEEWPDFSLALFRAFEEVQNLSESRAVDEYLRSHPDLEAEVMVDAAGKAIVAEGPRLHWLTNFYTLPFTLRYMGAVGDVQYDESKFSEMYRQLEEFISQTEITYKTIAPLQNFDGPAKPLRLDSMTLLRPFTDDELQHVWDAGEYGGVVDRDSALGWRFCLEVTQKQRKNSPVDAGTTNRTVRNVLTALRLVRNGAVGIPVMLRQPVDKPYGSPGGTIGTSGPSLLRFGSTYKLSPGDADSLLRVLKATAKVRDKSALRVALDRFNYAYDRGRLHDRVIDEWVALEALFLPTQEQELRFRAALRISYFAGRDVQDRSRLYKLMKDSYDLRSWIVHGESEPKKGKPAWPRERLAEVAAATEELIREILQLCILNPGEPRVDRLDAAIVAGETYLLKEHP